MSQMRRLAATAALFAIAIALVALAAALHTYGPLFGAWIPLIAAAWVLSKRDRGYEPPPAARPPAPERARPDGEADEEREPTPSTMVEDE